MPLTGILWAGPAFAFLWLMVFPCEIRDTLARRRNRVASALELFRLDHGRYPTSDEGLLVLVPRRTGMRPEPLVPVEWVVYDARCGLAYRSDAPDDYTLDWVGECPELNANLPPPSETKPTPPQST